MSLEDLRIWATVFSLAYLFIDWLIKFLGRCPPDYGHAREVWQKIAEQRAVDLATHKALEQELRNRSSQPV